MKKSLSKRERKAALQRQKRNQHIRFGNCCCGHFIAGDCGSNIFIGAALL
jgi:hypothetical protein